MPAQPVNGSRKPHPENPRKTSTMRQAEALSHGKQLLQRLSVITTICLTSQTETNSERRNEHTVQDGLREGAAAASPSTVIHVFMM